MLCNSSDYKEEVISKTRDRNLLSQALGRITKRSDALSLIILFVLKAGSVATLLVDAFLSFEDHSEGKGLHILGLVTKACSLLLVQALVMFVEDPANKFYIRNTSSYGAQARQAERKRKAVERATTENTIDQVNEAREELSKLSFDDTQKETDVLGIEMQCKKY